jgi:excisionase family DNA binding protein
MDALDKIAQIQAHMAAVNEIIQEITHVAELHLKRAQAASQGNNYITYSTAARRLGVHPATIGRMVEQGLLKNYVIAGKKRLKSTDIQPKVRRADLV